MRVLGTSDYKQWYKHLHFRERVNIDARLARIEEFDHFGDWKYLNDHLSELRWKNGHRIYFTKVGQKTILLLCGGLKNAQKKDIKRAKLILQRYTYS